jgi:hypothetical protein
MTNLGYNIDSKHVRLRLHKKLIPKFIQALPKGLGVTIYPVPKEKGKLVDENIRNLTFTATRRNPDPRCRKDMEDINNFLSKLNNIDPRIKLLSDKVTIKDQPNLMKKPWIKLETMLDSPKIVNDPEMQPFLKKAEQEKGNIRKVKVTESYLRDMEQIYKKMKKQVIKAEFNRNDLEEDKERDPETGEKVYTLRHGEI